MAEEKALTVRQEFTSEQLELIKRTIAPKTTDDEFKLFIVQCKRTGLDPFSRQIYAVKRWSSREQKEIMTIQTGIDGYRVIAERTQTYAPGKEPTFTYNGDGTLESATAYGWKLVAGRWFEVSATARYTEYVQKDSNGQPTHFWADMGHNQLAKCAEALLIRKCCPQDTSGIYTDTEMEQAENPVVKIEKPRPSSTPKAAPPTQPAPQPSAEPLPAGATMEAMFWDAVERYGRDPEKVKPVLEEYRAEDGRINWERALADLTRKYGLKAEVPPPAEDENAEA